jgi:small subunit ribosomal protein S16
MAVHIRLRRTGTNKRPAYRVVVADSRAPRDGRFIEIIGHYDPLTEPPTIQIEQDKADEWVKKGAQLSNTVKHLLAHARRAGTAGSPAADSKT